MAARLVPLVGMACDKLDNNADGFWNNAELKAFHRRLQEVLFHLRSARRWRSERIEILNSLLAYLEGLPSDVDELIDAWLERKSKFDRQWRRIGGRLVPLLNSLYDVVSDHGDEESDAISQLSPSRSGGHVLEGDLGRSIKSIKDLLIVNKSRVVLVKGKSGSVNTVLAAAVFNEEDVKAQFPSPFWFSVGKNCDLSSVVKAIEFKCSEIRIAERLLIVLDDVCDLNNEELGKFVLLISNMSDLRPRVLVTTHSDHVATMMRKVPAQQLLAYFPESDSWCDVNIELPLPVEAHSRGLVRVVAPEYVVMIELQQHSDKTSVCESAMDDDAASIADTQAMSECELQFTSLETTEGGLVGQVSANIVPEVPIHDREFDVGPSQKKKKFN